MAIAPTQRSFIREALSALAAILMEHSVGRTHPVAVQIQRLPEFRAFVTQQEGQLRELAQAARGRLKEMAAGYFQEGRWDDAAPFFSGENFHAMSISAWSLESVGKVVENIAAALFVEGAMPELPRGLVLHALPTASTGYLQKLGRYEQYQDSIKHCVTSAVHDALLGFAAGRATEAMVDYATRTIMPGMTLFIGIFEKQYSGRPWGVAETISQTAFVFTTYISCEQAGEQEKQDVLRTYVALQAEKLRALEEITRRMQTTDPGDPIYTQYGAHARELTADVKELQQNIEALGAEKLAHANHLAALHAA